MTSITEDEDSPVLNYTGRIRSIRIGSDYKDAMVFTVGNRHVRVTITKIAEDNHDRLVYGVKRYNVFAKRNNDADSLEQIWKSMDNMPCVVEYFDE